jgi:hypothetical protein
MILRGLPDGLTEASTIAAHKIKFVPAMLEGSSGLDVHPVGIQLQSLLTPGEIGYAVCSWSKL